VRAEKSTEVRQSAGHIDRHASYMRLRCVAAVKRSLLVLGETEPHQLWLLVFVMDAS
jgi:hypothetical protein